MPPSHIRKSESAGQYSVKTNCESNSSQKNLKKFFSVGGGGRGVITLSGQEDLEKGGGLREGNEKAKSRVSRAVGNRGERHPLRRPPILKLDSRRIPVLPAGSKATRINLGENLRGKGLPRKRRRGRILSRPSESQMRGEQS